jgi:hypothetical protein
VKKITPKLKKLETRTKKLKKTLVSDLDELMQKHSHSNKGGIIFSAIAIPSNNPERLVRWSGAGGFNNRKEIDEFIDKVSDEAVFLFCSNFSSAVKIQIIKTLIKDGPTNQKELWSFTKLAKEQFDHHIQDLICGKLIQKIKKDQYDITPMGHVLAMSFMGLIHSFSK